MVRGLDWWAWGWDRLSAAKVDEALERFDVHPPSGLVCATGGDVDDVDVARLSQLHDVVISAAKEPRSFAYFDSRAIVHGPPSAWFFPLDPSSIRSIA